MLDVQAAGWGGNGDGISGGPGGKGTGVVGGVNTNPALPMFSRTMRF